MKKYKDMSLYEIGQCIKEIRKECREKGVSCNSDIRYLELLTYKKKLTKEQREKEIKLFKMRDLVKQNNNKREERLTFQDLWKAVEGMNDKES